MTIPESAPVLDADFATGPVNSLENLAPQISPSRLKDFQQCPRLFYYKSILHLATPATMATTRGTLAHTAFEHLFDHPREERTPEVALAYVRPAWNILVNPLAERDSVEASSVEATLRDRGERWRDAVEPASEKEGKLLESARDYRALAPEGSTQEKELLDSAHAAVRNYFTIERPWNFDPTGRELHLQAEVLGVPLHGFIDRLDRYTTKAGDERWVITDYKTGKVPAERYRDEAFFALRVYAVLLRATHKVTAHSLRLVYVTAEKEHAVITLLVDQTLLDRTEREMKRLWAQIRRNAREENWEPRKNSLCNWCHFQDICPAWNPALKGIVAGAPEPTPRFTKAARD